ncbi:MAG: glycosyltransferase [Reyranellaceae bacterium]
MARAERVLFLTQYYAPERIGSAPYCVDLARWLVEAGFAVEVATGQPHYPDPALYAAHRQARPATEQDGGVRIRRLKADGPAGRSVRARIVSELGFLMRGLLALLSGRLRRSSLVLSLSPSIFCVALGIAARRRGGRHVTLIHDIQSGLAGGLGMVRSKLVLRAMRAIERFVLNRVDGIAVLTPEMAASLRALGVFTRIEVVPLWVDTEAIVPLPEASPPAVLYSGNLGRKQGLEQIVALARELQQRAPAVTVIVRGSGNQAATLRQAIAAADVGNIRIEALLPESELNRGLAEGAVHLVPQNPQAADFAMPSKTFNIMAAGRAFVATAGPGSALWRVQRETGAFLCVPPDDPAAFANAVLELLHDPALRQRLGAAGRAHVEAHHSRQRVLPQFLRLLEGVSEPADLGAGIVVLEPSHEGHPQEWLAHIVRFALADRLSEPLRLVVAPQLHAELAALVPEDAGDRIEIAALSAQEQRFCLHKWLVVSGFARWWIMRRYLRRYGARRGHFLALDHLSLPLALGLGANGKLLDGILFRPSVHYQQIGPYSPDWRERVRDLRKSVLYRLMLLNRSVESVLTLDPFFARYALSSYRGGAKVRTVPDPAQQPPAAFEGAPARAGENGRVRFLMFGYLAERKGILALLAAIAFLPPAVASRLSLVIAGSVDPEIRDRLRHAVSDLQVLQPTVRLTVMERRLSDAELKGEVERCDVVLAPYQRFVGSSGVLIWAASAGKPVLTQNYGLLHRLAQDYRLGLTADTSDAKQLAEAIERLIVEGPERHFDAALARTFIRERSPHSFAAGILKSV